MFAARHVNMSSCPEGPNFAKDSNLGQSYANLLDLEQSKHQCRYLCKLVCGPNVVTLLNRTPMFEQYVTRLEVKNGHQKDVCYNEIGLRVLVSIDTIFGFNGNHEGLCGHLKRSTQIFSLSSFHFYIHVPILKTYNNNLSNLKLLSFGCDKSQSKFEIKSRRTNI